MSMDDTGNLQVDPDDGSTGGLPDPTAQAPLTGGADDLTPLPLTPDQITEWWQRVDASRDVRKTLEEKWDLLLKEYLPVVSAGAEDIKAGIHFRNVHTKKAKLFFRNPELILTPEGPLKDQVLDPMTGMAFTSEEAAYVKAAVLNSKLGRKGVNVKRLMSEVLFDILAWAGVGFTKIGYRNVTKPVEEPVMQPDPTYVPTPAPGSMLGLSATPPPPQVPVIDPATGKPQTKTTMVPIWEEWYWTRFSPKKGLLPVDLHSGRIDQESPWIGMEFFLPVTVVRSIFHIPDSAEIKTTSQEDDRVYQHVESRSGVRPKDLVHGVEVWYKASIYDPTEPHPQAIRQLVMIDGEKEKVFVHRPSPDQTFDDLGVLTPDSLVGFPIQVFTNRDVADSPWPWADNAFTNSSVKHINTHRKQSIKLRDANIGKFLYDSSAFTSDQLSQLQRGEVGEWIAVMEGRLSQGSDKIIAPVIKNEASRDDWRTAATLKQDVEETLGIGGTNAGATADTVRTATEISTSASALAERLDEERDRILDDYLVGVEKFDSLLQRYADDNDYIQWVGKDGAKRLSMWNKEVISGRWAYTAKPDSQLKVDVARDRAQTIQFLEVVAPYSALINIKPLLKKLATDFGLDPHEVVLPDMPPMVPPGGPSPGGSAGDVTGALPNAPAPGVGTPQIERANEVPGARPGGR